MLCNSEWISKKRCLFAVFLFIFFLFLALEEKERRDQVSCFFFLSKRSLVCFSEMSYEISGNGIIDEVPEKPRILVIYQGNVSATPIPKSSFPDFQNEKKMNHIVYSERREMHRLDLIERQVG